MGMTQADAAAGGMPPAGQADMEAQPAGTPESNMQAMEQERMAQMEAIAQAAPPPEKPFTTTLITKLVDAVNSYQRGQSMTSHCRQKFLYLLFWSWLLSILLAKSLKKWSWIHQIWSTMLHLEKQLASFR